MSMLAMTSVQWLMGVAFFAVCVLLMLIILVQKGRGGGLAAAFGGGGGGGGAFGAKTGDVFTGITVVLAFVFLLLAVFSNYVFKQDQIAMPVAVQPTQGSANPVSAPATGTAPAPVTAPVADGEVPATDTPPAAAAPADVTDVADEADVPVDAGEDN